MMEGHIQIFFEYTDGTYNYSDALYLPEDHTFTEEQIEAMKKERFDNWKSFILNPPVPTPERIAAMEAEMNAYGANSEAQADQQA